MRIPKNGMLFMIIVIIVMTGIMIIANTNYQYHATLLRCKLLTDELKIIYTIIFSNIQDTTVIIAIST